MNVRKALFFSFKRLKGSSLPMIYEDLLRQDPQGITPDITKRLLVQLLAHCQRSVPHYASIIKEVGDNFEDDPESYLSKLPILTKEVIRERFEQLQSLDLDKRKWTLNTSGGSTGEPVKLIQDQNYGDHGNALQLFYSTWAGAEVGDPEVFVWGSERDILGGSLSTKLKRLTTNKLIQWTYLNAFSMTPEKMREFIDILNTKQPKLIIAYAQSIYELAQFAKRENIVIHPQSAIITSAGTLYPFMRETIERAFHCQVFNRYGSREVGDMAGECTFHKGLHVFPWNCYIEIVDEAGYRVPAGAEGNIIVTCLSNFAMPLIRYQIGDRGMLSIESKCPCGRQGQILEKISGRNVDVFKKSDGTLIDGEYFTHLLYFRPWVLKFQVIQKSYASVLYRIKKCEYSCEQEELDDITSKTQVVMGQDCLVNFEFVDDIPNSVSGKYRYTISEVDAGQTRILAR